jgi:hypothetical protein
MLNDPEYFVDNLGTPALRHTALSALESFPPSPSARHAIIQQALLSDGTDQIILPLYALCDISDPAARAALTKMTYTRLFEERLEVYRTLINATLASNSVREFITTMKFFVPRIKNEIPPDAGQLPYLFSEHTIIDLLRRATDEEAAEIASVYVAWENQVNEAVSPVCDVYLLNLPPLIFISDSRYLVPHPEYRQLLSFNLRRKHVWCIFPDGAPDLVGAMPERARTFKGQSPVRHPLGEARG